MFAYLKSCFRTDPKAQCRGLLLGLDSAGKSTLLYKLGGQVVTTIPTIGFNVETLSSPRWHLTCWDVGGCDKIRPLWTRCLAGAEFLLYLHDCSDTFRLEESLEELRTIVKSFSEAAGKHVFVLLNKQDALEAHGAEAAWRSLRDRFQKQLEPFKDNIHVQVLNIHGLNCKTGYQLDTAMSEIRHALLGQTRCITSHQQQTPISEKLKTARHPPPALPPTKKQLIRQIQDAGQTAKDPESFWNDFQNAHLPAWDHYAHLRAGYFILLDRMPAGSGISDCVDEFVRQLDRLRTTNPDRFGNTSHRTMTCFWLVQLRSAALEYSAEKHATKDMPTKHEFQQVLLHSPHLMNTGLWRDYYSKGNLFSTEAKVTWRLPDLQPLPGTREDDL